MEIAKIKSRIKFEQDHLTLILKQVEDLKNRTDIPEETDTIKNLLESNGKNVVIQDGVHYFESTYTFENGEIKTSEANYPLFANDSQKLLKIVDPESGKVVFANPYSNESLIEQYAKVLGKKAGLEEAQLEIDDANDSLTYWKNCLEEAKAAEKASTEK